MNEISVNLFDDSFVFRSRPKAIPGDLRPLWRISVILLILELASRGGKSSLSRMHVLNWAIRTLENQQNLLQILNGTMSPNSIIVRIEPSLNRALEFAHSEGLIDYISGKRIQLSESGRVSVKIILDQQDLLASERTFLTKIGKSKLTEKTIDKLFSGDW